MSNKMFEGTITQVLLPDNVELENGSIVKACRFQVELDNGSNILAYLPPKKRYHIKFSPGERVKVELNPYDLTKGKITSRQFEEVSNGKTFNWR